MSIPPFDPDRSRAVEIALGEQVSAAPRRRLRRGPVLTAAVLVGLLTVGGGAAYALTTGSIIPSNSPSGTASAAPVKHWPTNGKGQTYGSIGEPVANYPDLIAVSNGICGANTDCSGYVLRDELDSDSAPSQPSDAASWNQSSAGGGTREITLFNREGAAIGKWFVNQS
ncbi:hypothetical protein P9139_06345 [Curtobacterium flaccumfaciens]|nr:hypothetical protein P9139_06345 [Curtobacterium flaccumfaciens]